MKRPQLNDFKREVYDGDDFADWYEEYYKALEKYADYLEGKRPEAWIVDKPGKRSVVDAKIYSPNKPSFWIDGKIPEGCSVTPLYPGNKITKIEYI